MASTGSIKIDPLFVGLTRPPMFLGVSYSFALTYVIVSLIYFIQTSDFKVIFYAVSLHLFGYVICFKEPLFIELYMIKFQKCNLCKNRQFHGANSYDMT